MSEHADPLDTFRDEAAELLERLESALIDLEEQPERSDLVDEAFRDLHTIKGSAGMFGLQTLVDLAHTIETAFVRVRDGVEPLAPQLVAMTLSAVDHLAQLVQAGTDVSASLAEEAAMFRMGFVAMTGDEVSPAGDDGPDSERGQDDASNDSGSAETTYRIIFRPAADLFRNGNNPLAIIKELNDLGRTLVVGHADAVPPLVGEPDTEANGFDPEACYFRWEILLTTSVGPDAIRDVFIFLEGDSHVEVVPVDHSDPLSHAESVHDKRIGEILVERGEISRDELASAVADRAFLGDILVKKGYVGADSLASALAEQTYLRAVRRERSDKASLRAGAGLGTSAVASSADASRMEQPSGDGSPAARRGGPSAIKVSTDKLDTLVDLVGEFVSAHAGLTSLANDRGDRDVATAAEQIEALVAQLRDVSMAMRMVPIRLLFDGFRRLVRDLSRELGKTVELVMEGTDTELDKNIIEELRDPVMHIIRNSVDHGIEDADERRAAGKPAGGRLLLRAYQAGAHVVIEVVDDGRGIDPEKVRRKAVERGLVAEEESLSEHDTLMLIYRAGFSTAAAATSVSGRGVGMDVVKRNIEALRGSVHVESTVGRGTSMRLRIPLTLAIVEGLLAGIGGDRFFINLAYIEECIDLPDGRSRGDNSSTQMDIVPYRGGVLPTLDMREFLHVPPDDPHRSTAPQVVVVRQEERRIGLVVDRMFDKYQSVVKSLGKVYSRTEGVAGAVILGDGAVALMLDIEHLLWVSAS